MQTYLRRLKAKPRRVRERIAVGASLGITGLVALGWLAVMVVTNPFSTVPEASDSAELSKAFTDTTSGFSNLLGAVGASRADDADGDGITVVDAPPDKAPAEPTVIPF